MEGKVHQSGRAARAMLDLNVPPPSPGESDVDNGYSRSNSVVDLSPSSMQIEPGTMEVAAVAGFADHVWTTGGALSTNEMSCEWRSETGECRCETEYGGGPGTVAEALAKSPLIATKNAEELEIFAVALQNLPLTAMQSEEESQTVAVAVRTSKDGDPSEIVAGALLKSPWKATTYGKASEIVAEALPNPPLTVEGNGETETREPFETVAVPVPESPLVVTENVEAFEIASVALPKSPLTSTQPQNARGACEMVCVVKLPRSPRTASQNGEATDFVPAALPEPLWTAAKNGEASKIVAQAKDNGQAKVKRYRGVRKRFYGKWGASICELGGRRKYWLGTFDSPEQAARAYDKEALRTRGLSANLNFPEEHRKSPSLSSGRDDNSIVASKAELPVNQPMTAIENGHAGEKHYLGVRKVRSEGKWGAVIYGQGKRTRTWLGTFRSPEEAARVYDKEMVRIQGNEAKLNFPDEHLPQHPPQSPALTENINFVTVTGDTPALVLGYSGGEVNAQLHFAKDTSPKTVGRDDNGISFAARKAELPVSHQRLTVSTSPNNNGRRPLPPDVQPKSWVNILMGTLNAGLEEAHKNPAIIQGHISTMSDNSNPGPLPAYVSAESVDISESGMRGSWEEHEENVRRSNCNSEGDHDPSRIDEGVPVHHEPLRRDEYAVEEVATPDLSVRQEGMAHVHDNAVNIEAIDAEFIFPTLVVCPHEDEENHETIEMSETELWRWACMEPENVFDEETFTLWSSPDDPPQLP